MTQVKQRVSKLLQGLLLMSIGAIIFAAIGFSFELYSKREAIVVAWEHPEVVKDLQINVKTIVEKK